MEVNRINSYGKDPFISYGKVEKTWKKWHNNKQ